MRSPCLPSAPSAGELSQTGSTVPWALGGLALALVVAGGAMLVRFRRSTVRG